MWVATTICAGLRLRVSWCAGSASVGVATEAPGRALAVVKSEVRLHRGFVKAFTRLRKCFRILHKGFTRFNAGKTEFVFLSGFIQIRERFLCCLVKGVATLHKGFRRLYELLGKVLHIL